MNHKTDSNFSSNLRENFNPKSIAYECLRLLTAQDLAAEGSYSTGDLRRVVARLELASIEDPEKIEEILQSLLPAPEWAELGALLGKLGSAICVSREPRCSSCPLSALCPSSFQEGRPSGSDT